VGRAIALELARAGCDLVIHFHAAAQPAVQTVNDIVSLGRRAQACPADLRNPEDVRRLFVCVDEAFGRLDILVNSAAVLEPSDLLTAGLEDWQRTIDLNLRGSFLCLQEAAHRMLAAGGGAIVNISDIAGLRPWRRYPIHSVSKAGVEMLTRVAALALAPRIRVNAVAPGPILRPERLDASRWEELGQALPLRRVGQPEDAARAVRFLLENDYITGETLVVDGGDQLG
jgi:pteridine reductase